MEKAELVKTKKDQKNTPGTGIEINKLYRHRKIYKKSNMRKLS